MSYQIRGGTDPKKYSQRMTSKDPVIRDIQNLLYSVTEDVDEMKGDLMWCVIILAKMTNTDPPSSGA